MVKKLKKRKPKRAFLDVGAVDGNGDGNGKHRSLQIVDFTAGDGIPATAPGKIKNSPNAGFYIDAIRSGWSLRALEAYALKYFGESISVNTFRRLKLLLPPADLLPMTYREKFLRDIDVNIEPIQELMNLIEVQKQRVTEAIDFEQEIRRLAKEEAEKTPGAVPITPPILPQVRQEIELLYGMIKDLTNLQVNMGILNHPGNIPRETGVSMQDSNVRAVIDGWTDDQKKKFLTTVDEIEAENKEKQDADSSS